MKRYHDDIVYFISYSKLPSNTPATNMHELVGCGLFINQSTGIIEDVSCTLITEEARIFLKELIVGNNLHTGSIEDIIGNIKKRYYGLAQKAICTSLKETYAKYSEWKKENIS